MRMGVVRRIEECIQVRHGTTRQGVGVVRRTLKYTDGRRRCIQVSRAAGSDAFCPLSFHYYGTFAVKGYCCGYPM